jgi:hypothetical protein
MKALSQVARDWQLSSVLRYQSGSLIGLPSSNNSLLAQLGRVSGSTGNNYWNLTGRPYLTVDPNCHCFNPQTTAVLNGPLQNPSAPGIVDAPAGTFSTSAPYYNSIRWQRQPAESMAFARVFRIKERYQLQIRAEFQNIFNRLYLAAPTVSGPGINPNTPITQTTYAGLPINNSGFGGIATLNGAGSQPRSGQIIARFQF